jgi:MFS family permease
LAPQPAQRKKSSNLSAPIAKSSPGEAEEIAAASAPENGRLDPSVWKISTVGLFGAVLAQIDATIVNLSLSNLAADLNSSLSTIQWVTSGYLLALTLVPPLNGWLVDRIGAKALYLSCFSAFTLSSARCGLAWSASSLIAFRVSYITGH